MPSFLQRKKKSSFGISVGDYEAKPLWHISQRVCSKLGLIFSLMHQSSPCVGILLQEGLLFSTLQLSFISFLLFLLKTLSEWERLSSDNSQLSTHLSIHPFIHLLPVSTFLYIKESLIRRYCCIPFNPSQMQRRNAFISCTLLHVCFVLCPSPLSVVFLCLPLLHTSILNMTKWLSVWWSIFKHLSHLSGPFHSLLFLQRKLCSQTFLLFLYHKSFIFHFFILFIISRCLPFSPLSPISSLSVFLLSLSACWYRTLLLPLSSRTILSGWSECSRCSQAANICFPLSCWISALLIRLTALTPQSLVSLLLP